MVQTWVIFTQVAFGFFLTYLGSRKGSQLNYRCIYDDAISRPLYDSIRVLHASDFRICNFAK